MTPERFAALAEAYGGMIGRWPAECREAARAHLLLHPEAASTLADAGRLDATLARWTVPGPGAALAARTLMQVAGQPAGRPALGGALRSRRLRLWFSSLGAAGVLAGGLASGAAFVSLAQPGAQPGAQSGVQSGSQQAGAEQSGEPLYEVSVLGTPLDAGETPGPGGQP